MIFFVNDVFEPVTDLSVIASIVRLIHLDETHDLAVVIDLADPPRQPYAVGLEELHRSLASGHTKPVTVATPEFMLVLEDQLDETAKQGRDEKWAIIAPLLDPEYPGRIFARGELGRLVSKRASELGVQRKKIYRLLYRYWIYGQVRNSLLNNYSAVGVADRKYDPSKPPGRKPKFQGVLTPPSKMLSAVDKRCIRVGYALYVKDKKSSISSAYDEMLRRFYSVRDISKNSEEELRLLPSSEIPSLRQFRYWGQIFFDEIETERGR